jgi:hypothetical protein
VHERGDTIWIFVKPKLLRFHKFRKKIWRSIYQSYEVDDGDILFVKKGASINHQFLTEESELFKFPRARLDEILTMNVLEVVFCRPAMLFV